MGGVDHVLMPKMVTWSVSSYIYGMLRLKFLIMSRCRKRNESGLRKICDDTYRNGFLGSLAILPETNMQVIPYIDMPCIEII